MEDDLNFKLTGRLTQFVANKRLHQFVGKWNSNIFVNGRQHQQFLNVRCPQFLTKADLGTAQPQLVSFSILWAVLIQPVNL
jgi:hypothetical protein